MRKRIRNWLVELISEGVDLALLRDEANLAEALKRIQGSSGVTTDEIRQRYRHLALHEQGGTSA